MNDLKSTILFNLKRGKENALNRRIILKNNRNGKLGISATPKPQIPGKHILIRYGVGCRLHENCFACPDRYADSCSYVATKKPNLELTYQEQYNLIYVSSRQMGV